MARAGVAAGPPVKRRRIGPKVLQAEGSSSPSLADLARLAASFGGLVRPPPPRDPYYACHPQMQFFLWWGRWQSVGTALQYATAFQDAAVVGPLQLPSEAGARGGVRG